MIKPTVPEVLPLAQAVYGRPDGSTGCCAHILLDDCNVGKDSAEFCLNWAREKGHPECIALCEKLVLMSKTQHLKLVHHPKLRILDPFYANIRGA